MYSNATIIKVVGELKNTINYNSSKDAEDITKLKDGNKNHPAEYFNSLYECPGNCDICKAIHRGCVAGENTFAKEH